ncbi:MAG TPA: helix-turn-helix transcriptional regulator [Candidatus Limnocylindrales bacterium]|nr:helix-turn-helix transcriptional regulator [Candidatus Limnocylindrales bacterium]
MKQLTKEQIEFAVGRLQKVVEYRGLSQPQLEEVSGIAQSTISKIFRRIQDPSPDNLKKLCRAIGVKLSDLTNEIELFGHELVGYLATPLTGLSLQEDEELRRLVERIRKLVSAGEFSDPQFDLYWPGDHTHPRNNPDFTPSQVYLTDRSRASTYDFIILLCVAPSYGVGQENEIATQAGQSAIRLVPPSVSRMMKGSFINAKDIGYRGALSQGIEFEDEELLEALRAIRRGHFRRQAFYKNLNGQDFGERLRKLINERGGDYEKFADDVGINLSYLHALMEEPFNMSNPSVKLLKRIAALLGESVGYLVGEKEMADPVWVSSQASFREWVEANPRVPAGEAFRMRDAWRDEYKLNKNQPVSVSFRRSTQPMSVGDWDRRYKQTCGKAGNSGATASLFDK